MFKYAIQFANTANSLPNLDFDNRYVGTANFQGIFGICMTHISLLSTRASDLYTWHILSLYLQIFIVCKFDDKFRISYWICGYRIWIPIFEHYNCIANAFARHSNSAPSAVHVLNSLFGKSHLKRFAALRFCTYQLFHLFKSLYVLEYS
jgi:hypothetical protein